MACVHVRTSRILHPHCLLPFKKVPPGNLESLQIDYINKRENTYFHNPVFHAKKSTIACSWSSEES
jgi:hypothetical protein